MAPGCAVRSIGTATSNSRPCPAASWPGSAVIQIGRAPRVFLSGVTFSCGRCRRQMQLGVPWPNQASSRRRPSSASCTNSSMVNSTAPKVEKSQSTAGHCHRLARGRRINQESAARRSAKAASAARSPATWRSANSVTNDVEALVRCAAHQDVAEKLPGFRNQPTTACGAL